MLEVYNSTLSGNYASQNGGGLRDTQLSALYNVTVFGNRAGAAGGGVYFASGEFPHPAGRTGTKLVNTIVAGNRQGSAGTEGTPDDVIGALASGSEHDLIGGAATAGGLTNGANGNIVGVDWRDVLDPVLRDNGGPTPTHALFGGSRAFERGTESSPLATDQRGARWVVGQSLASWPRATMRRVVNSGPVKPDSSAPTRTIRGVGPARTAKWAPGSQLLRWEPRVTGTRSRRETEPRTALA